MASSLPNQITIRDKCGPAMEIQSQGDADTYFDILVEHNMRRSDRMAEGAAMMERSNLG